MNRALVASVLALAVTAPLLSGCENSATAYTIDTSQHALILVREQPYFWTSEVDQYVIASRLPNCQRKVRIHPDGKVLTEIEVFEAGYRMWALRQGARWYLAGTEQCLVQDWANPTGEPPGERIGAFRLRDGKPLFERTP